MRQPPELFEIEINEPQDGLNNPNFEEKVKLVLFEKLEDYEIDNIRIVGYSSDEDQDFLFEIDLDTDRIIKSVYTDEKGVSKLIEVERIKDVEGMSF